MSIDEYERLAAVNAASEKEYDRLRRAVDLPHKFGDFIAATFRRSANETVSRADRISGHESQSIDS